MAPSLSQNKGFVRVLFLGALRHALGVGEVAVEVSGPTRWSEVLKVVEERVEKFRSVVEELKRRGIDVLFIRGGVAVTDDDEVSPGDVVYVMPPTSGG